jgi:SOS-response transcriptional repressor LexA
MAYVVDRVVICDAYQEPNRHYQLLPGGRSKRVETRRPSMRFLASAKDVKGGIGGIVGEEAQLFDDLSASSAAELNEFVNQLRDEVRAWRDAGYPGTAVVTRRLLEWWFERDEERRATGKRFFFCQQEAVETVIYLYEVQGRRRMPETGDLADGKRCHTNKVPCHTDLEKRFADFLDGAKDVVRYFKNERLGFSVTYYESNRPRQYYPDFVIVARDADGREVMWLAEPKGEVRPNTALKSEAARLWCEKMSGTKYGQWRYLFLQQRKLEAALASGVRTLVELAEAVTQARPEPQLRLISLDDERIKREAFKTLLPLHSLKAAAGYFGNGEAVEPEGWVEVHSLGRLDDRMFVSRAVGRSMEPTIRDGDFVVFRAKPAGTRQGKIVLVQYRGPADPETGGAFTVKRYSSEKEADGEGGWRHTRVVLSPTSPEYSPIILSRRDAEAVQVVAEFVTVLRSM